jgi:hypothetical protein
MDPDLGLAIGAVFSIFLPPRLVGQVQIEQEKLAFLPGDPGRSEKAVRQDKPMIDKPFEQISQVILQRLPASQQRLETLLKSSWRMLFFGGVVFLYSSLLRGYGIGPSLVGGLATALIIGPLNFILNGGLSHKQVIVRLRFLPAPRQKAFYLEIDPADEGEFCQALRQAGLRLQRDGE